MILTPAFFRPHISWNGRVLTFSFIPALKEGAYTMKIIVIAAIAAVLGLVACEKKPAADAPGAAPAAEPKKEEAPATAPAEAPAASPAEAAAPAATPAGEAAPK
ncbi:MAG: hypothetical protein GMKNLPBB_01159 [Myxococcota bacterium]|nr:hypothetical protein [Myxococcota bacterium]